LKKKGGKMKNLKRTDLACEKTEGERVEYCTVTKSAHGIEAVCSYKNSDITKETVTLTVGKVWMYNDDFKHNTSLAIANYLSDIKSRLCQNAHKILIAGLGNRFITSDALGRYVVNELFPAVDHNKIKNRIYVIAPGVEGQSGIATFDIIKSAASLCSAELLVLVDSLCAKAIERLLSTIQISTEGIMPGSGVGSHKKEISKSTMGIPVISIGVPTVTDLGKYTEYKSKAFNYFVSPNDIDISVKGISKIIAHGIEIAFYK
jgi:spore protease